MKPQAVAIADQDHSRVAMAVAARLPGGGHQALDLGRRTVRAGANCKLRTAAMTLLPLRGRPRT
jgi:hypothetical protein